MRVTDTLNCNYCIFAISLSNVIRVSQKTCSLEIFTRCQANKVLLSFFKTESKGNVHKTYEFYLSIKKESVKLTIKL